MPEMTPIEAAKINMNPHGYGTSERNAAECLAASYLRAIAAGEYKQAVHGYWEHRSYIDQYCSVCGESPDREQGETPPEYDICPYCGAVMDGKDESHE